MTKTTKTTKTKNSFRLAPILVLLALAGAAYAQSDAQKAFDAIKAMPGNWEGKTQDGRPISVSYTVTSGGSAVMSEIHEHGGMISMIHLDGPNRLLMTHYCTTGNQPRMQASVSPDGKVITFNYFDATNLSAPDAGHMKSMVLTLVDENHHIEDWTYADHGKELKQVFDLRRKM